MPRARSSLKGLARVNRGPAAAPANRVALLGAARRLMARHGVQVPLSRIAQEAGVGQGVLYRHFPTRLDLTLAVFEENFAELEAVAAQPGPEAFLRVRDLLVDQLVESTAFLQLAIDARADLADYGGMARLQALAGPALARARSAGLVPASLTLESLAVGLRMAYGVIVTARPGEDVGPLVEQALAVGSEQNSAPAADRQPG